MGSKFNDKCPCGKRRRHRGGETQRRPLEDRGRDLSYAAISQEMPGNAGREKVGYPLEFRGRMALLTSRFWTAGLQNHKRINLCFQLPGWW